MTAKAQKPTRFRHRLQSILPSVRALNAGLRESDIKLARERREQRQEQERQARAFAAAKRAARPTPFAIDVMRHGPEVARAIHSMTNWQRCRWLRAGGKPAQAPRYAAMPHWKQGRAAS